MLQVYQTVIRRKLSLKEIQGLQGEGNKRKLFPNILNRDDIYLFENLGSALIAQIQCYIITLLYKRSSLFYAIQHDRKKRIGEKLGQELKNWRKKKKDSKKQSQNPLHWTKALTYFKTSYKQVTCVFNINATLL